MFNLHEKILLKYGKYRPPILAATIKLDPTLKSMVVMGIDKKNDELFLLF